MTRVRRMRLTIEGRALERDQAATIVRAALRRPPGSLPRTVAVRDPGNDRALAASLREALGRERR
jgi:hypothetical protein